jgi:hypothetical protein
MFGGTLRHQLAVSLGAAVCRNEPRRDLRRGPLTCALPAAWRGRFGTNASLSVAPQASGMPSPLPVSAAFRAFGRGIVWGAKRRFAANWPPMTGLARRRSIDPAISGLCAGVSAQPSVWKISCPETSPRKVRSNSSTSCSTSAADAAPSDPFPEACGSFSEVFSASAPVCLRRIPQWRQRAACQLVFLSRWTRVRFRSSGMCFR